MKTRLLTTLAFAAFAAFTHPANAAPGDLDLSFGGTGKVTTDIGGGGDEGHGVVVQPDGKIVVAGSSDIAGTSAVALARYTVSGLLDTSFGTDGKVVTPFYGGGHGYNVALQPDGKIVVAGNAIVSAPIGNTSVFAVARYTVNGVLDASFGTGGGFIITAIGSFDYAKSVAVQTDGKIVVAGTSQIGSTNAIAVVRYGANGSLDTNFNGTGKVTTSIGSIGANGTSVAIQGDGRIVVAGSSGGSFAVVRYKDFGALDASFGTGGKVTNPIGDYADGRSLILQSDGKIVVAGSSDTGGNSAFAVVRYTDTGALDATFGTGGKITTPIGGNAVGNCVAVQANGKVVVGGTANFDTNDFVLARYTVNGALDISFGTGGKVITSVGSSTDIAYSVAIQSDGRIVVAGASYTTGFGSPPDFAVVRYEGDRDSDGDGISDIYETGTGIYVSPTDTGTSPTNPDTDGDGLTDGQEVNTYHSNPNVRDTDGDGFDDGFEVTTGFSPTSAASTPDALSSIRIAAEYRFNAANGISYRIEASTDFTNWQTIEPNIIGTGGVVTRFYSIEGQPKRFFRSRRN